MLPWILLDVAKIPGGGELRLKQRGGEFSIVLGAVELMNSRRSASEEALGAVACSRLAGRPTPRILIGGLGMGFTLRAALDTLGTGASVTVAELVPGLVAWARGPMSELFGASLDDKRVTLLEADVAVVIGQASRDYDAILLDVDNGPDALTQGANDRLYDFIGLTAARRALRPGGVLAVWSSAPDPGFGRRLTQAGFHADAVSVSAGRRRKGARHVIWVATVAKA